MKSLTVYQTSNGYVPTFGGKIIFSGKRNIIFPNNTRKIKFQRDFFGKTIFSGRLQKENMVFRAVVAFVLLILSIRL